MADEKEKTLKVILEYETDKTSTRSVKDDLKDIQKGFDDTKKRAETLKKTIDELPAKTSKVSDGLNKVDAAGRKLEQLGRSIGGAWGDALATIGNGLSNITNTIESLKGLKAGAGGGGLLFGAGGGITAAGALAAGATGAGLGAIGYEGLRRGGYAQQGSASLGQFASVGAYYGKLLISGGDTKQAQETFKNVAVSLGLIPEPAKKAAAAVKKIAEAPPPFDPNSVRYAAGQDMSVGKGSVAGVRLGSLSGIAAARRRAAEKEQEEVEKEEQKIENERAKVIRDSKGDILRAEIDFNRERKQEIARYNLETRQQEKEHQIQIQRMRQDANQRLNGLAIERDAVSFLQEWQSSQTQIKRANDDFTQQQKERRDQFSLQLTQDRQDFLDLQAERQRAAARQLDELKSNLSQEGEIRKAGYQAALNHARDFASQMGGIFGSVGGGNRIDSRIAQTLGVR